MLQPKKILVLAPHTDDGELGCGASLARFAAEGAEIHYAAFSTCEQSLPEGLAPGTLAEECKKATATLGISPSNLHIFDFQVREFPAARQKILDTLRLLNSKIEPDLVFLPAASDIHQDHEVIYREGLRAFKGTTIAGYELPWNQQAFTPTCFVKITEVQLQKKLSALKAYQSQSHRRYMKEDFIRSLACVRGVQSQAEMAEAFELYRCIS